MSSARSIVRDVLPRRMADEIWSGQYEKVLPITFNEFELSAVLPAIFYMFRFGQRRGRGSFLETFAPEENSDRERKRAATVERIAEKLSELDYLEGFEGSVRKAILGDLLLGFNIENIRHELGRDKQVQRVAPTHYMASWVDLPDSSAHLRFVPEMIVAMLADQVGENVEATDGERQTWFPVARTHEENVLLSAFSHGIERTGPIANLASDRFNDRSKRVGVDQLLMIRFAQLLGAAPNKVRGRESGQISNQRPISERAARDFSEDIRRFIRSYGAVIPRHAFVDMLEACVATGMTSILTSVVEILLEWSETGTVIKRQQQQPAGIFVDCSHGIDRRTRSVAERSLDDLMRRVERIPAILMMLRILDYAARDNRVIRTKEITTCPYATEWLELLGSVLHGNNEEASFIQRQMDEYGEKLATELMEDYPETADALRNEQSERNPIRRLALALTTLLGAKARSNTISMVDSTLNVERPNGLAHKRKTSSGTQISSGARRQRDVRSLVFSDSVLDYLVHLHLLPSGNKSGVRAISLGEFLERIRSRYGFYIDTAPPGMTISNELLRSNRLVLERRLRDLGLLVGVNDAETMKRLQPRFELTEGA